MSYKGVFCRTNQDHHFHHYHFDQRNDHSHHRLNKIQTTNNGDDSVNPSKRLNQNPSLSASKKTTTEIISVPLSQKQQKLSSTSCSTEESCSIRRQFYPKIRINCYDHVVSYLGSSCFFSSGLKHFDRRKIVVEKDSLFLVQPLLMLLFFGFLKISNWRKNIFTSKSFDLSSSSSTWFWMLLLFWIEFFILVVNPVTSLPVIAPIAQSLNDPFDNVSHHYQTNHSIYLSRRIGRQAIASQLTNTSNNSSIKVSGFRAEGENVVSNEELVAVKSDSEVTIRLFGSGFPDEFMVGFTMMAPNKNSNPCYVENSFEVKSLNPSIAVVNIKLSSRSDGKPYFLCYASNGTSKDDNYVYAGSETYFQIKSESPLFPLWMEIIIIVILLAMSGLFSGLNLGLMALDKNELQVIQRCGTEDEKYYAKAISPVRKRGNYLLCTLLLGNVLVNSTLTIFLDELTSGIAAVIVSTLSIVIFGEIIPQAMCSRHGLAVGAKTIFITYVFMVLTFPLSFPISLLLDKILGEEIGNVYDRERLMEYIKVTKDYNNLEADEMNIISGALKFKKISVADVMTPISDVFMLSYDTVLNFDAMSLINNSGYSRIPVFETDRDNVIGILHVKDLALIDPDHNLPLKVVLEFHSHPLIAIYEDVTLDKMLNEFKQGKSHMALVRRVIDNGITDPYFELLGVVTLEDIIEELIQAEINDETDVISDNRRKQKRKDVQSRCNYLDFIRAGFNKSSNSIDHNPDNLDGNVSIAPQLALAVFRFLAASVEPFRSNYISEEVLKMLMEKSIYYEVKGEPRKTKLEEMSPENILYQRGKPYDYFIMILEGRARVIVTCENQEYDAGPFCCFGITSLGADDSTIVNNNSFAEESGENSVSSSVNPLGSNPSVNQQKPELVADFTLLCLEKAVYLKVTKDLYQTAIKTTFLEKKRTTSLNKSQQAIGSGADFSLDFDSSVPKRKNLANLDLRLRKLSLSTNLPDSSLIHQAEQLALNSISANKPLLENLPNATIDSLSKRKSTPIDSVLKRSDAIDLIHENRFNDLPNDEKNVYSNKPSHNNLIDKQKDFPNIDIDSKNPDERSNLL